MLTVKEAAKIKEVSPGRISQLIHEGKIPAEKIMGIWTIKKEDLDSATWKTRPGPILKKNNR
jgi:excisionase family DNA binding protein